MTLETYQKFVNFRALHAEVRMGGYSTPRQSVFMENGWEYQLHFGVTERRSRRPKKKKNKFKRCKTGKHRRT
jgi:hypothetical protein